MAQQDAAKAAQVAADTATKTLSLSTRQFTASQRPYLSVEYIRLNGDLINGKRFALELMVKNTGRTAAVGARPCEQIIYTAKRLTNATFSPEMDVTGSPSNIGADQEGKFFFVEDIPIPEPQRSALSAGIGTVYVHGIIRYSDIFTKETYSLPFCGYFVREVHPDFAFCELPTTLVRNDEKRCQEQENR